MTAILHLSDLHFEKSDQVNRWYGQLAEDLRHGLDCQKLNYIILSGDIADKAQETEYNAAETFIKKICEEFELAPNRILIVPGNHDVDWTVSKDAYKIVPSEQINGVQISHYSDAANAKYAEIVTDPDLYRQRFKNFAEFYGRLTGQVYSLDYGEQVTMQVLEDAKLIVVGLSSASEIDHRFPERSSINSEALEKALTFCRLNDESFRKIAVWHHPIVGNDKIKNVDFLERLFKNKFDVVMHGHIHKAEADQFTFHVPGPGNRAVTSIGAGTFGARDPSLRYPWQYNLLKLDERGFLVKTRGKLSEGGAWGPDARWIARDGDDPKPEYLIRFKSNPRRSTSVARSKPTEPESLDDLNKQLQRLGYRTEGYRIAVEALIFNNEGKMLLQKRGKTCRDEIGKLEGIGGDLRSGLQLHDVLRANLAKKIGPQVRVSIDQLLEIRPVRFVERGHDPQDWIVVSYLCHLKEGEPVITDPHSTETLEWYTLEEIFNMDDARLSRSTSRARDLYRIKFRSRPYFAP